MILHVQKISFFDKVTICPCMLLICCMKNIIKCKIKENNIKASLFLL